MERVTTAMAKEDKDWFNKCCVLQSLRPSSENNTKPKKKESLSFL